MIDLYDAAIAEVRNKATSKEMWALNNDLRGWRNALLRVIDEMDAQFRYREEVMADKASFQSESAILEDLTKYHEWKLGARTFKKHIEVRLSTVERMINELGVTPDRFANAIRDLFDDQDDAAFDDALDRLEDLLEEHDLFVSGGAG